MNDSVLYTRSRADLFANPTSQNEQFSAAIMPPASRAKRSARFIDKRS
jgi:hypothetical protein